MEKGKEDRTGRENKNKSNKAGTYNSPSCDCPPRNVKNMLFKVHDLLFQWRSV